MGACPSQEDRPGRIGQFDERVGQRKQFRRRRDDRDEHQPWLDLLTEFQQVFRWHARAEIVDVTSSRCANVGYRLSCHLVKFSGGTGDHDLGSLFMNRQLIHGAEDFLPDLISDIMLDSYAEFSIVP